MSTARQVEANRANARKSTGPRTPQGKARASRSARRHGLSIPVLADSGLSKDVEDLARMVVGYSSNARQLEPARSFAEAQVDLARIRQFRHELLSSGLDDVKSGGAHEDRPAAASSDMKGGAEKFIVNLSNQIRTLKRLDRYERRALSRRKSATREFDAAHVEAE
jgi:hypothetical protein